MNAAATTVASEGSRINWFNRTFRTQINTATHVSAEKSPGLGVR